MWLCWNNLSQGIVWNSAAHGRILVKEINMYVGEKHLATSNKQFVVILLLLKLLQLII